MDQKLEPGTRILIHQSKPGWLTASQTPRSIPSWEPSCIHQMPTSVSEEGYIYLQLPNRIYADYTVVSPALKYLCLFFTVDATYSIFSPPSNYISCNSPFNSLTSSRSRLYDAQAAYSLSCMLLMSTNHF